MPRPTAHKTRDSPTPVSDCETSRHNPGIGIMAQVVNPRLLACSASSTDARAIAQNSEVDVERSRLDATTHLRGEKGGIY